MKKTVVTLYLVVLMLLALDVRAEAEYGVARTLSGGTLDQTLTGPDGFEYTHASGFAGVVFNLSYDLVLESVGDYVELEFEVTGFWSNNNNPWSLRFGLYDNGGTPTTENNETAVTDDWVGYLAWYRTTNTNTNQTNNAIFAQGSGSSGLMGTTQQGGGFGGNPTHLGSDFAKIGANFNSTMRTSDAPFTAIFRIERTADGLDITSLQHSNTGATIVRSLPASAVVTWTVNAFSFAHNGNLSVSDIRILSNVIPHDDEAPVILSQPVAQSIFVGDTATFTVEASGIPEPGYQWRKDGVAISGATASTFSIVNAQTADSGWYDVVVSNTVDSVSSDAVTLSVIVPNTPPVADPQQLEGYKNTPLEIVLTASDIDNDPLTFSIATQPDHGTLSGTPPALVYTPDAGFYGQDTFTFTAFDGEDSSAPATESLQSMFRIWCPLGALDRLIWVTLI
ncbi:MAG: Ig-like domain-containing protein [Verrucomicrobia bacterium]|nr:Ig-like domain-containing protein [Verrucomicrobiota bacterium]